MKKYLVMPVAILTAALLLPSLAPAQDTPTTRPGQVDQRPPSIYQKMADAGPGGPAPVHDLNGFWNGPLEPKFGDMPSLDSSWASKIQAQYSGSLQRPFERPLENLRSLRISAQHHE